MHLRQRRRRHARRDARLPAPLVARPRRRLGAPPLVGTVNGPEHYQLAEVALDAAAATQGEELHYTATEALLDALAHATLALAAAVVDGPAVMRPEDRDEWDRATGRPEVTP
jgi:hypothetical protein